MSALPAKSVSPASAQRVVAEALAPRLQAACTLDVYVVEDNVLVLENLIAALVVLSNYATDEMRARCLASGADRVFDKSRDIDLLVAYCIALSAGEQGEPGTRSH